MTREDKVREARSLLEQAAALNLKAWEMVCEEATQEEIDDSIEASGVLDESVNDLRSELVDNVGWKTYVLLDYWEMMAEEEDEATKIIRQRDQGRSQS